MLQVITIFIIAVTTVIYYVCAGKMPAAICLCFNLFNHYRPVYQ